MQVTSWHLVVNMGSIMTSFMPFIQQMIIGSMAVKAVRPRFSPAGLILKVLSCALLLVGLFLALYAEYIWLGIFLPLYLSTLITAITIIILALSLGIWGNKLTQKQSEKKGSPVDITTVLTDIISSLDEDLEGAIRTNPKIAVALSTLGGFMVGKKYE